MKQNTKILALSAALVALSVILMYLGALSGVLDIAALYAASLLLVFSVIEFGGVWPWLTYAATAVLAVFLLSPSSFTAWEYVLVIGLLPMLKAYFEKLPRPVALVLKFVAFNLLFGGTLTLFYLVFKMPLEAETVFGLAIPAYAIPALLGVLGNLCFFCYDVLTTRIITLYYAKYRDRVRRALHL